MKTNFRFLALSAAILSMFTACQREELEQNQKPEAVTHSVTFVAGAPETKTTATIDGSTVNYAWTAEDVNRFTVYENGIAAKTVTAALGTDGTMSMKATFPGEAPASPKYQALYNSEVSANQNIVKDSYAEVSDVMVSNVLDGTRDDNFVFSFKREVAFAKMTLKSLTSGAYVSSVTIESDKPIAGKYDLETGTFVNTSNVITLDVFNDVVDGNATVWFTTIPVEEAIFTITAKTTDDAETVAGTYTKTFTKPITLTRGDVKGFGVEMAELVDPHKNDNGWFLVKDARFLAAGDVIRIGCASAGKVAGALSGTILSSENATYESEQMVSVSSAEDYTLGGTEGAWTLSSLTGKLGATAVKILSISEDAQGYIGTWTISIDNDGAATIAPNAEEYGRILCYNTSNQERFTTYTSDVQSNMLLPGIYKKYGTPAEAKKDQTISFNPTSYKATIGAENTYPTLTAQSSGAKTWSSSNTEVATINESTGEITLVAAGKTTISVTVAGDDTYNEGTGSYELTVENAPIVSTETWSLVTDASSLAVGDVIVIVAASSNFAMSTTQNTNNRGQQAITKNSDTTVTIDDKVQQLTLGAGKNTGTFSLSTGSGYLYAASSSDNYLKTNTTLDANGSWSITITNNIATIKAQGTYTHNLLKYNSSSKLFSCYKSGQGDVQIYKLSGSSEGGSSEGGSTEGGSTEGGSTGGSTGGETTYSYKFTSKAWGATLNEIEADWTSGKDGNNYNNNGVQVTTGVSGANATSPIAFTNVSKIVVRYCTNAKDGKGTVTLKVGDATFGTQSISAPSSGGTTEKSFEISTNTPLSGNVNIKVTCSKNSIYIIGIDITAN